MNEDLLAPDKVVKLCKNASYSYNEKYDLLCIECTWGATSIVSVPYDREPDILVQVAASDITKPGAGILAMMYDLPITRIYIRHYKAKHGINLLHKYGLMPQLQYNESEEHESNEDVDMLKLQDRLNQEAINGNEHKPEYYED